MKEILSIKCMDRNEYIKAMATKMTENFDKYWGECNLLMAIVVVLDPRYKMKLINFYFPLIYPEPEASMHIDNMMSLFGELYEVYMSWLIIHPFSNKVFKIMLLVQVVLLEMLSPKFPLVDQGI
jgi:hypothetical protein